MKSIEPDRGLKFSRFVESVDSRPHTHDTADETGILAGKLIILECQPRFPYIVS